MTGNYAIECVVGFLIGGRGNSIIVFAPPVHVSFYALALSSQGAISNKTGELDGHPIGFLVNGGQRAKGRYAK